MNKEYLNSINNNTRIIDLRARKEYLKNHYENSINISYEDLMSNYKNFLVKNKKYYIMCDKGQLSKRAASMLNYFGYNIIVLEK